MFSRPRWGGEMKKLLSTVSSPVKADFFVLSAGKTRIPQPYNRLRNRVNKLDSMIAANSFLYFISLGWKEIE